MGVSFRSWSTGVLIRSVSCWMAETGRFLKCGGEEDELGEICQGMLLDNQGSKSGLRMRKGATRD